MATKFKRILSLLLATVLCVSCIAFPAVAEENDPPKTTFPITKTANGLDANDQTDVTLTVPGTIEGYVDVVFILGGGMTANMKTIESAINVFKPVMENGKATVRMGLISLEKGKEIILDLNSDEAVLDPATYVDFVTEKFDSINDLPYGTTNLHSQLLEAQKMLAKEKKADPENKYVFVLATGRTYWFDDANGEQATIVNKINGTYYWGNYLWQSQRGRHTSLYMLPDRYNNSYEAFFADVEKWVAEDGDTYVYTPHFDVDDYSAYVTWEQNNNKDLKALGVASSRFGNGIVNPKPTDDNFITGTAAGASSSNHPSDALNYERAQYECVQVWKELIADGYNCYSICSENPNYQNGSEYIKLGAKYTGTSTTQVGHSFMNYLATLAGQTEAPTVWDYERDAEGNFLSTKTVLQENFFDSVRDDMLYTTSIDSTVVDYIGKNENGNFEFIENADYIKLTVGGVEYTTVKTEDTDEGSKYAFAAEEGAEPTFWLDYYYGDGETTERFVWTFGENVSLERLASLTYKLQLTDKQEEAGKFTVPTNNSATLYPKDSDGKDGDPQVFPIPEVEYEVVPYDVDIVLALGAGIAQYDADNAKGYTHTYDSIVNLVAPLVNQGINVKLGLVAVEHYDDVAMLLTVLTKDNYEEVITEGLKTIQSMPAGPTNLHGNIVAAKEMLDADKDVPDENKFFYVFATGRTYNYDNADGVPTTIVNKIDLKGNTYYYWGHYLWQSQRGRHTSLYMIPDAYGNDFDAYWADVENWVAADGDDYAFSFTDAYDNKDPQWFNTFFNANNKDAKALGLASSRFGWIMNPLTNSGHAGIGSGANPQNALSYERAQYEAYQAYKAMAKVYNCYALCTESPAYQNESLYITLGAGYKGSSEIQLGHSFMDHLAKVDGQDYAPVLFEYIFSDAGSPTGTDFTIENYFDGMEIDKDALVKSEDGTYSTKTPVKAPVMMSPVPPALNAGKSDEEIFEDVFEDEIIEEETVELVITEQPEDVEGAIGDTVSVTVEAEGEGLKYQWYFRNAGAAAYSKSSTKVDTYEVEMTTTRANREVYCVITDAYGNSVTSETATLIRIAAEDLEIVKQPEDVEGALGETVAVTVEAKGEGLKYQWYFKNAGSDAFSKSSTKTATYDVEMTSARAGRELYCVITDAFGNTVTSETATLIRIAAEDLEIVKQPEDAEGALGETVAVTVEAKGEGLKYQWYFKNAGSNAFSKSSTKTATYDVEMTSARIGRELYCVITDAFGNTVTSDTVKLIRVAATELAIVEQPTDVSGAIGDTVAVKVVAQGEGLKYRWYFCNAGSSTFSASSITTDTYEVEMNTSRGNRLVYCVITDALGNTVTTDTVQLKLVK